MSRAAIHAAAALVAGALSAGLLLASCAKQEGSAFASPDYQTWRRTTSVELDYPIPGHGDQYRLPRMNAMGFSAVPTVKDGVRRWDFPAGTVIVKEVYGRPKPGPADKPVALTIMAKRPDDPRSIAGWLWLMKQLPDGKETVFPGNYCVTCHENANEPHPYGDKNPNQEFRDYVYFVPGEAAGGGDEEDEAEEYGTGR